MSTFSHFRTITNGTRQVGILSPYLFSRYICEFLGEVDQSKSACCNSGMMLNVLAYDDDLVLLEPSWTAMQDLLHLLKQLSTSIDTICSIKKTTCMILQSKHHSKIGAVFPTPETWE